MDRAGRAGRGATGEAAPGTPWERRDWEGAAPGLVRTVWMLVARPRETFRLARASGPWSDRVLFAVALCIAGGFLDSFADLVAALVAGVPGEAPFADLPFGLEVGDRSLTWIPASGLGLAGCLLAIVVGVPIATVAAVVLLFLGSAVLHAAAWLTGVLASSPAVAEGVGYRATALAAAFATVGFLAHGLPWVGDELAVVWSVALVAVGLSELHDSTLPRALGAALAPLVPLVALVVVMLVFGG